VFLELFSVQYPVIPPFFFSMADRQIASKIEEYIEKSAAMSLALRYARVANFDMQDPLF
jgi:hypothetical protein